RAYASFEEAVVRMREANPRLTAEQALHLTRNGVIRYEDGTYAWKFDNFVRAVSPYLFNLDDAGEIWSHITCPVLLVRGDESWAPVEAETERTIERILGTQFVDEAEVRRQIRDDRPRALAHLERVRAYAPRSRDVQHIHARYVSAWEELLGGYDAIEQGFTSGDYTKL